MKTILTTLLFFSTLTLFGQVNDADAFFNGSYDRSYIHKHKILQATVETYVKGNKTSFALFDFDRNGILTKETVFESGGKMLNEYTFTYNKYGDQTLRKGIAYVLNKTYTYTVLFSRTYDGSLLVEEKSSEWPFVTKYLYNLLGKRVQSITFINADTTMSAKLFSFYAYDIKGKLRSTQETYAESNNSTPVTSGKTDYIFDAAGNVATIIREGKATYEFSYDKTRLLKSKTIKMPEDIDGVTMFDKYYYKFWK